MKMRATLNPTRELDEVQDLKEQPRLISQYRAGGGQWKEVLLTIMPTDNQVLRPAALLSEGLAGDRLLTGFQHDPCHAGWWKAVDKAWPSLDLAYCGHKRSRASLGVGVPEVVRDHLLHIGLAATHAG